MTRVTVLGAGVVGSTYAALLAHAGHEVTLVARGTRATELLERGLRVQLDDALLTPAVTVVGPQDTTDADVLLVAVRGDQLAAALEDVAESPASNVWMFANPLGLRDVVEKRVGRERLVWCFSGLGGGLVDGLVTAHRVKQQPTVVETGVAGSSLALRLLSEADAKVDGEPDMHAWLDTHTVFVAAMGALIIQEPMATPRERLRSAARLVRAMRQGFDALEAAGTRVTPSKLRTIFGKVPLPFAAAYWATQLGRPVVQVSMRPHAEKTWATEGRAVAEQALRLTGTGCPRYRRLVEPLAGR